MAQFSWSARDPAGRPVTGVAEAAGAGMLAAELRGRGWLVLGVEPVAAARRAPAASAPRAWWRPRPLDVEQGLRQVAVMHRAGLPILRTLETAAENARGRGMARLLSRAAAAVSRGRTVHEALAAERGVFPPLVLELVRAGEASGTLEQSLERGAEWLEQRRVLGARVLQACFYPALVVLLTAGVCAFLLLDVIPVLEGFLAGTRSGLPWPTRLLVSASRALRAHGPTWAVVAATLALALLALDRQPLGRRAIDRVLWHVPGVRGLRRLAATALLARTLSVLLDSGLTIAQSLPLARGVLHRPLTADALEAAHEAVLRGEPLSVGLPARGVFQPMLVRMVAVGEQSGELAEVLRDVAAFHEKELASWLQRASALIEPVLTVVVGAVVGFVYVSFFLALFAAAGGLR